MFTKNFTKKLVSVTSAFAIIGALTVPAMAAPATPVSGTTSVFYTSENVIVGPEGSKWGVKIPSGVSFTNNDKTKTGDAYGISLISMAADQKGLEEIYTKLEVSGTVQSKNGFKFEKIGAPGTAKVGQYEYKVGGTLLTVDDKAQDLPVFTLDNPKYDGEFTLKVPVSAEGKYSDTLTFTFTEKAAVFANS